MAYTANITKSGRELTKAEILDYTDFMDMSGLNGLETGAILYPVTGWALVEIHNDKCETPDYTNLVLEANGEKYYTSSSCFTDSFFHIAETMGDDEYGIKITRKESKNHKGKDVLRCKIATKA